jgi:tetratricopeptide (TPR) repeat protein
MRTTRIFILLAVGIAGLAPLSKGAEATKIWEAPLVVPTYPAGAPDPSPQFFEGRGYQGAKGPIYPYPIIDKLFDTKQDRTYKAVYLENEYIRICVLPELGGRIFEAIDKTNGYNFFYRQHVIKPALIGMLGAWISGGVEWNIPHHHRASSFMPVSYKLAENPDGSKTIWVGEMELRHQMRWAMGLTLRPGKAYLEGTMRLFNRTPVTHSFLYFANVAVHANQDYQVIFPPSVHWATQHSKVEFSSWPVSHQRYGGVDFSKGVDVSWYKNHPSSNSMFAFECKEDFLAGYDHGKHAGTLHIADHGIMPGKKFFTWGNGSDGRMWDGMLTDTDGAYLELMVGGYSDNQPDYSWIQPYEVKTIREYWYPFRDIDGVKNANLDAAVNLEVNGDTAKVGLNTTEPRPDAKVAVQAAGKVVFEKVVSIAPGTPFVEEVKLPPATKPEDVKVTLSSGGRELISYQPAPFKASEMPPIVTPPPAPDEIKTNEELVLAGQRLEQFYSPAREPEPYYLEALKRDPSDYRANTALGLIEYNRGLFAQAEERFKTAVARVSKNYTRPRDGEAYYYLGLAQRAQGKEDAALEALYRASWSFGWNTASYYALAETECRRQDYAKALEDLDRALSTDSLSTQTVALESAVLRHLGRMTDAGRLLSAAARIDPLDPWVRRESRLALGGEREPIRAGVDANDDVQPYLEIATDYGNAGMYDDAVAALQDLIGAYTDKSRVYPLAYYYLGFFDEKLGKADDAVENYALAAKMPPDYCFPFRLEEMAILRRAIERNPKDPRAPYYLGNLLYDLQPEEAIKQWEAARSLDPAFAMVHRNLALAYARRRNDVRSGIAELEAALARKLDPRWMYELDELYQAAGTAPATRLAFFKEHQQAALDRDDVLAREIMLEVETGDCDEALKLLSSRKFYIWEGASISAHDWYVDAHLLRGHKLLAAGKPAEALKDYAAALEYPVNLGVGKPYGGDRSAVMYYYMGAAYEASGDAANAKEYYRKAAAETGGIRRRRRMRADAGDLAFYRALALQKLGEKEQASGIFQSLVTSGEEMLAKGASVDDFAKFGARTSKNVEQAGAHYLIGLGQMGLGKTQQAKAEFEQAVKLDVNQMWAAYELAALK